MTRKLVDLKPSTQAALSVDELESAPLGGIYVYSSASYEAVVRLDRFSGGLPRCSVWMGSEGIGWLRSREARIGTFRHPKLPRFSFALTTKAISTPGDQPSGRCKSVTRRKKCPPGIKPGHLFLAIDKGRRSSAHRRAAGLAAFEWRRLKPFAATGAWARCVAPMAILIPRVTCVAGGEPTP